MTTDTMDLTTITLNLTPYQEARLLEALTDEVRKWHYIGVDARSGARPSADPIGADMLKADAQAVLNAVREQIEANR